MNRAEHVHFIGIGGYGMSAIARVMLEMGYQVSGSDVAGQELTEKLAAQGAQIYIGHQSTNIKGADLVVYSTALAKDNVERMAAQELNIPVLHRAEMLSRLMNAGKGIAVAGAHGKTTTSSMLALVMETCGLDPTFVIGGEIVNVGTNAKAGKGEYVVAEADESDGSFLNYHPEFAIVTNIEPDHLENYDGDFNKLKQAYVQFLQQVKPGGKAIVCTDGENVKTILEQVQQHENYTSGKSKLITFAIDGEAEYRATKLQAGDRQISFTVEHNGKELGVASLLLPGKHNVYNAMATLIAVLEAGVVFEQAVAALRQFRGAKRRFQVLGDASDILIVDDYAHHPTEIQATISAAKSTGKRIVAVFQPQRYTRTFFLFEQFSRAFGEADEVVITDIYSPAGEQQIEGISSAKLVELIKSNSNEQTLYIPDKEQVVEYLTEHIKPGDLVITMGAGDIWKVSKVLAGKLLAGELV